MTEEEFDATNPDTHHQANLIEFIMQPDKAVVQTIMVDGERTFVEHKTSEVEYDIFTLRGIESKITTDTYAKMPEKLAKLESACTEKTGAKRYTKDDIKKFIRAWCFNKCRAKKDYLATREDFMLMVQFIEDIVFNENEKARTTPPKGVTQAKAISKYYNWVSFKFKVKVSVESFVRLEEKIRRIKKKAEKKDIYNVEAETEKVVFLQTHMVLKPGQYCSGMEFAGYFKEIYKAMFPKEFGTDKGLKKGVDGIEPEDKAQTKITKKAGKSKKKKDEENPLEDGEEEA